MSQNKNYAHYYDFDQNRTKTKVSQMPGGNSQFSLAWDVPDQTSNNKRGGRNFTPGSKTTASSYGSQQQNYDYQPYQNQNSYQQPQQNFNYNQQQSYQNTQNSYQQNDMRQDSYGNYDQMPPMDAKSKPSVRVNQQPGGNSNMIFGDYNYFQQDQSSGAKPPRSNQFVRNQQQPPLYSPIQNSYNNMINNNYNPQPDQPSFGKTRVSQPPGGRSNFSLG